MSGDCLWCGSLSHDREGCPDRAEVADRARDYATIRAAVAYAEQRTCARWVSSYTEDEDVFRCGRPGTVEALTTSGEWEPHCGAHVAGWPADRVRALGGAR